MGTGKVAAQAELARAVCTTGVSAETAGELREFIRAGVREMLVTVMLEEVELLCGL